MPEPLSFDNPRRLREETEAFWKLYAITRELPDYRYDAQPLLETCDRLREIILPAVGAVMRKNIAQVNLTKVSLRGKSQPVQGQGGLEDWIRLDTLPDVDTRSSYLAMSLPVGESTVRTEVSRSSGSPGVTIRRSGEERMYGEMWLSQQDGVYIGSTDAQLALVRDAEGPYVVHKSIGSWIDAEMLEVDQRFLFEKYGETALMQHEIWLCLDALCAASGLVRP